MTIAITMLIVGLISGLLRLKVLILLPAITIMLVATALLAIHFTDWYIIVPSVVAVSSLQVGYLGGLLVTCNVALIFGRWSA